MVKIVDPQKRMVTFLKRREGIKSKATELCRLFADIIVCIIVFSPGGKAFTFTNSPVGVCNMVQRFLEEQRKGKKQERENVHRSKNSTQCRDKAGVGNGSTDSFWWHNIDSEELGSCGEVKAFDEDCIIEDRNVEDAATSITEKHEAGETCCKDQHNLDLSLNLGW
ncbi:agamous-like MADS-box protein AGL97 [Papaver somniferum]|uniref:agamous-like MADS-box protein AGL97 n=1 Tax=Papaver somniferum TaxID=3469 RepID=UPI000E6F7F49|nr:agamous-like MADS-box protein AGL97 [Papaver somniferum]